MGKWETYAFESVLSDNTKHGVKIPKESYLDDGLYPIIDQGKSYVAGYTNDETGLFDNVPAIVFGDHTRVFKYIDFPFFIGADGVKLLKSKFDNTDHKFLYYFLQSSHIPDTGYNRHFKWLKDIKIPLPPLPIQQKIADLLDLTSALIEKRKTQIEKLDLLIKSRFVEMYGDPVTNPMGWDMHTVEETVAEGKTSLKAGPFGSSLKKEYYVERGYKIYGQEQVILGDVSYGDYYISKERFQSLKSCEVQANDVLISLVGTYGRLLVIPDDFEPGIINPRLMKITFNPKKVNTTYFRYFFGSDSLVKKLSENTHGGTMDILNLGIVRKIHMPLPPLNLQNRFADFVRAADKSKSEMQQGLEKLELLYKSLMQKCFVGELYE